MGLSLAGSTLATMDANLAVSIARASDAAAALEQLDAAGCTVTDALFSCQVVIPAVESDGLPYKDLLDQLREFSNTHLFFEEGVLSFELVGTPGSPLDFLNEPVGDPGSVFGGAMLQVAERAWQGDINSAVLLGGRWRGDITVQLQAPFQRQVPQIAWSAVRVVAVLEEAFAEYPWWRSAELIRVNERPVIVVVMNERDVAFCTPSFSVASLDLLQSAPMPTGINARRTAVQSCSAARLPVDMALPEELMPIDGTQADQRVREAFMPKAEACAWAWLSNTVTVPVTDGAAKLEFFGYRRKTFELDGAGYVAAEGQLAYSAYRWATAEDSPDRVLAVRQVVSLQDGSALPNQPDDVVTAAEPLYQALRAGEVAAVLETQRQARSIAIDTAHQGAGAAQTAAKSAAERTIASLGAVAGVVVANATAVLSAANARAIAVGIAALFIFLVLWATCVEGPSMQSPITSLTYDLPGIGYLLTKDDRETILHMRVLQKAKHSVIRVRIATPVVYILGAAVTVGIAHVRFGLKFP
jgi:hypothetical protein